MNCNHECKTAFEGFRDIDPLSKASFSNSVKWFNSSYWCTQRKIDAMKLCFKHYETD